MPDENPNVGHNSRVAQGELRSFVERVERLEEEERADINAGIREVYAEAKSRGYDVKVLRKVVQLRKKDPQDFAEFQAVLQIYIDALDLDFLALD